MDKSDKYAPTRHLIDNMVDAMVERAGREGYTEDRLRAVYRAVLRRIEIAKPVNEDVAMRCNKRTAYGRLFGCGTNLNHYLRPSSLKMARKFPITERHLKHISATLEELKICSTFPFGKTPPEWTMYLTYCLKKIRNSSQATEEIKNATVIGVTESDDQATTIIDKPGGAIPYSTEGLVDLLAQLEHSAETLSRSNSDRQIGEVIEGAVKMVRSVPWDGSRRFLDRINHLAMTLEDMESDVGSILGSVSGIGELLIALKKLSDIRNQKSMQNGFINNLATDERSEFEETVRIRKIISQVLTQLSGNPESLADALERLDNLLLAPRLNPVRYQHAQSEIEKLAREITSSRGVSEIRLSLCLLISRHLDQAADLTIFRERLPVGIIGPEMVIIPACPSGFLLGAEEHREGHRTAIHYRFAIGRFPVTFEEYDAFCIAERRALAEDEGWGRDRRPIINVNHRDINKFINWLNFGIGYRYSLPHEEQWEFACRGDVDGDHRSAFSLAVARLNEGHSIESSEANFDSDRTVEVDYPGFEPNEFYLMQMHGNVWEQCFGSFRGHFSGDIEEINEEYRMPLRGGAWNSKPEFLKANYRSTLPEGNPYVEPTPMPPNNIGFRIVRLLGRKSVVPPYF